jgi:trimeric autotransporter adhesin
MPFRRKSLVPVLALAASMLASTGRATAQCTTQWEPFVQSGIGNATIETLTVDASGTGSPIVYVGGNFETVGGGVPASCVAKWDGQQWTALGGDIGGVQYPTVYASALFDDDGAGPHPPALFVGGNFTTAGGVGANYIAKWDGSSWSALGSGMDSWVRSMAVFDDDGAGPHAPALYAGGFFQSAGGVPASCVARWDGTSWSAVGGGVTGSQYLAIWAMTLFDDDGAGPNLPALIVGGSFSQAGGVSTSKIARWNGSSWSGFGTGLGNPDVGAVLSLASWDDDGSGPNPPALCAGGLFNTANGAVADDVARWNGATWSDLGGGVNNGVWSMSGFDDDGPGPHAAALYVCGGFWLAGGSSVQGIARWDGTSWSSVGGGLGLGIPYATAVVDLDGTGAAPPRLLAAGDFTTAGEMAQPTSDRLGLAAWNGTAWGAIGGGGFGGGIYGNNVYAMSVFDEDGPGPNPPALFAGGDFVTAAGVTVNQIARWNGWNWTALGTGLGGASGKYAGVLKTLDEDGAGPMQPALYVGGGFDQAGGVSAANLAKWNGSTWTGFGAGPSGGVYDIAVFDDDGAGPNPPALFVAGRFTVGGGVDGILRWNGSTWLQVGGGVSGGSGIYPPVWALAVFDDDGPGPHLPALYAGGDFATAGGVSAHCVAKWDGTAWSALGSGVEHPQGVPVVGTLEVFDEDGAGPGLPTLFAGGAFTIAGGNLAYTCARWDGSSWIPASNQVVLPHSFSVLDYDGTAPGLPVLFAGGQEDPGISYWYGSTWYPLGGGVDGSTPPNDTTVVWKVSVFDEDDAGPKPPTLFVGGDFTSAGGLRSATLARLPTCSTPITSFCAGDGSSHACPCNNSGATGHGCANSANGAGALLTASGDTGVTGDSVSLISSGETGNVTSVFLQGSTAVAPVLYGDGLRCIGGSLKRLYVKTASAGVVRAPLPSDVRITTRSAALGDPILPGYIRQYQVYYRDSSATFCPIPSGSTYNISNGLKIAWGP